MKLSENYQESNLHTSLWGKLTLSTKVRMLNFKAIIFTYQSDVVPGPMPIG